MPFVESRKFIENNGSPILQIGIVLENFIWPTSSGVFNGRGQDNVWFQQDGNNSPQTARRSFSVLRDVFSARSLRGDIQWRSPVLTPRELVDFFFISKKSMFTNVVRKLW